MFRRHLEVTITHDNEQQARLNAIMVSQRLREKNHHRRKNDPYLAINVSRTEVTVNAVFESDEPDVAENAATTAADELRAAGHNPELSDSPKRQAPAKQRVRPRQPQKRVRRPRAPRQPAAKVAGAEAQTILRIFAGDTQASYTTREITGLTGIKHGTARAAIAVFAKQGWLQKTGVREASPLQVKPATYSITPEGVAGAEVYLSLAARRAPDHCEARGQARNKVLAFFQANPGTPKTVQDIMAETGLQRSTVRLAIVREIKAGLIEEAGQIIDAHSRGPGRKLYVFRESEADGHARPLKDADRPEQG